MKTSRVVRTVQSACAMVMLATAVSLADPSPSMGNPDTNASDRNYDTNQPNSAPGAIQKTQDAGNRALNHVDNGVHKGIRKTKHAGHRAKRKMHEEADKMSEPAVKP